MPLRTPLYDWHLRNGRASSISVAGTCPFSTRRSPTSTMPYAPGPASSMSATWAGSRSQGTTPLGLIDSVFSNDAASMKAGQVRYGLICNDKGGIQDDVLVYRWPSGWGMVVNASNRVKIVGCLEQRRTAYSAQVMDHTRETCMIAVQGPKAVELCRGLTDKDMSSLPYYYGTAASYRGTPSP